MSLQRPVCPRCIGGTSYAEDSAARDEGKKRTGEDRWTLVQSSPGMLWIDGVHDSDREGGTQP